MRLSDVFHGASPILVARILQLSTSFAISVLVVATYGLESAGVLALAALPSALGGHIVCLGLQNALPRSEAGVRAKATIGLTISVGMVFAIVPFIAIYSYAVANSLVEAVAIAALSTAGAVGGHNNVAQMLYVLQKRQRAAPIMAAIYLVGVGISALAPSLASFALAVLGFRVLASVAGFAVLTYERFNVDHVRGMVSDSIRFAPLDIAGLLADQLPIVLVSTLLTREELGLLGLLRQFVTVADMPGYSLVFNHYPDLVRSPATAGPELALRNERLAWAAAAGTLVVASLAAYFVYRLPILVAALPLVLLSVPARYFANFCEQALRASGEFRKCALLAGKRIVFAMVLFFLLTATAGFWGAVIGFLLNSVFSGLLYRWAFVSRYPGALRALRPWRLA